MPKTLPEPPVILVPPIITPAITMNSIPTTVTHGFTEPNLEAKKRPATQDKITHTQKQTRGTLVTSIPLQSAATGSKAVAKISLHTTFHTLHNRIV